MCGKKLSLAFGISSSNAPRFEPNPNTGRVSGADEKTPTAINTVYFDAEGPSHVVLPIAEGRLKQALRSEN